MSRVRSAHSNVVRDGVAEGGTVGDSNLASRPNETTTEMDSFMLSCMLSSLLTFTEKRLELVNPVGLIFKSRS